MNDTDQQLDPILKIGPELQDQFIKEGFALVEALMDENDRGCVLVAASCLDNALERTLRERFKTVSSISPKELDSLFCAGPIPPLRSLYLKTMIAFAAGVIDKPMKLAFDAVRSVRNDAAHVTNPVRLSDHNWTALYQGFSSSSSRIAKGITELLQSDQAKQYFARFGLTPNPLRIEFAVAVLLLLLRLTVVSVGPKLGIASSAEAIKSAEDAESSIANAMLDRLSLQKTNQASGSP